MILIDPAQSVVDIYRGLHLALNYRPHSDNSVSIARNRRIVQLYFAYRAEARTFTILESLLILLCRDQQCQAVCNTNASEYEHTSSGPNDCQQRHCARQGLL